jgi:MFS transporter, DHA1 family, multidrug resistance protein
MTPWKRNLYAAWITQILSLTGFGFAFPFLPYFIQDLGVTDPADVRFWTGMLSSAPALSMGIMAPIWGFLADKIGKKLMLLRAMLFGSFIVFGFSLAQSVEAVFVLRTVQGAFTGTVTASAALIAAGTPRDRLSYALGFLSSSNFIGISLGPLVGGLIAEYFGYRASFVVGAGILIAGFVGVLLYIRDETIEEEEEEPEQSGAEPASASAANGERAFGLRNLLAPAFVAVFLMIFLMRFGRVFPVPFIPLYVQQVRGTIDGSSAITGLVSALRGAATAAAGVTLSRLGDRYPRERLIGLLLILAAVTSVPIYFTQDLVSFTVFAVVFTFFLGGVDPLLLSSLSARTPAKKRGMVFGIQTTVGTMGWFLAPLAGSWVSIAFSIRHVFLFMSGVLFLIFLVSVILSLRQAALARK